ncbi:MAG TPA: SRPBCC family protein [Acidimicrobiales bacterium]
MTTTDPVETPIDPALDLVLEREIDVPTHLVWAAWTTPEHLKQWFTPKPFETAEVELDLRPGGIFRVVMRSPEGEEMDQGAGCILDVVEGKRLVWTGALGPGYRPVVSELPFTAVITMEPSGAGTRYRAVAKHGTKEGKTQHEEMGFQEGWGAALDQLVELARGL